MKTECSSFHITFTNWLWFLKQRKSIKMQTNITLKKVQTVMFIGQLVFKNKNPDLFKTKKIILENKHLKFNNITLKSNARKTIR